MKALALSATLALLVLTSRAATLESVPPTLSRFMERKGPLVHHQVFAAADRPNQLVASYCVDDALPGGTNEGANNPSFTHCHVALFNRVGKSWIFANERPLGQGEVQGFAHGIVSVQTVRYKPGDALCCPSAIGRVTFSTDGGRLVVARRGR